MADEKRKKVKTKVKASGKSPAGVDAALDNMTKLFIEKPITGEMDYLIKKQNGEIVVNEYLMSESLKTASGYAELGAQIQELAQASLAGVTDGKIKVLFESKFEEISN
ncbi:MAG: hypothetical protein P8Q14_05330 [Vicingaceae bacterium]|nr:hypothetical protein [Vicingaceae bacterium]